MTAIETIRTGLIPVVAQITDEFFLDTITVRKSTNIKNAAGQRVPTWADDPVLVGVRANIQTATEDAEEFSKVIGSGLTIDVGDFVITLGSYQTGIDSQDRILSGDGVLYEVFGVEYDSVNLLTRLACHLSNPGTSSA